jgi:hypothetical protein
MAEAGLDYQKLTQQALRGVVRSALEIAARQGLPGDHHFFIAFSTGAPGVNISSRLREKYPEEMTIVLQHQYWGLEVFQDRFQVKLSFNNTPETLVIPFAAVKGFLDPSVQFGLQFETGIGAGDTSRANASAVVAETTPAAADDAGPAEAPESADEDEAAGDTAAVVSLDAFRKK